MNRLKDIFGPAPSEDPEGFYPKLMKERERVSGQLMIFLQSKYATKKTKKPKSDQITFDDVIAEMKALGCESPTELFKELNRRKGDATS